MAGASQTLGRRTPAIIHVERAIDRYNRDLALLTGRLVPMRVDLDDLAFLDSITLSLDPQAIVNDRKLRIKTLEATLDMLRETAGYASGRVVWRRVPPE